MGYVFDARTWSTILPIPPLAAVVGFGLGGIISLSEESAARRVMRGAPVRRAVRTRSAGAHRSSGPGNKVRVSTVALAGRRVFGSAWHGGGRGRAAPAGSAAAR